MVWTAGGLAAAGQEADPLAERITRYVQSQRAEAGVAALERRAELDRIARDRAELIAALPHARRLSLGEPIEDQLAEAGITWYARASTHMDMNRGYTDPGGAFLRSWRDLEGSWSRAMSPRYDALGIATAKAPDDWIVLVTVLLEDMPVHDDLASLEQGALLAVNQIREEHGLEPLLLLEPLGEVARAHSEDMAVRDYFSHASPEGQRAEHRVRDRGIRYLRLAENIQMNRGWPDPVQRAVGSWMDSDRHREAILTPEYRETAVGVAVADDGTLYFTQLFVLRRDAGRPGRKKAERP